MEWTLGRAIEHGSFLMALAAVLLSALGILLVMSGVIAYIRVKSSAKKIAREVAQKTAREVAEYEVNLYLQSEMPAIMSAYMELARNSASYEEGDRIAASKNEEQQ